MKKIAKTILETIGETPLVEISSRLNRGGARVLAKVERFNPGGSSKDRVGVAMLADAEEKGLIASGSTIVEPTSGNTGIGLAIACAIKGYHLVLTMPDTMSIERRRLAKAYGAEIVLTPGEKGMTGAVEKAQEIARERNGFIPQQFENLANAKAHRESTGPEIWDATNGEVDIFVAGVGTGGTISGVGEFLKSRKSDVQIVAIEPSDSPVIAGGKPGPHRLQGIGAGFVPKVYNPNVVDKVIGVSSEDAGKTARDAAACDGLLIGISSGAALFAALELAKDPANAGRTIVVLLPDTGERYLSTWLFAEEE